MEKDAPWAKSRTVQIKAGERLKIRDPQHPTKGAKKGKNYRESKRPDGFEVSRNDVETIGLHMTSRQRYKARRQARMAAERANGVRTKVAPALKSKDMRHTSNVIATDEKWILHDAMKGKDTKAHVESHAKLGIGVKAARECC